MIYAAAAGVHLTSESKSLTNIALIGTHPGESHDSGGSKNMMMETPFKGAFVLCDITPVGP